MQRLCLSGEVTEIRKRSNADSVVLKVEKVELMRILNESNSDIEAGVYADVGDESDEIASRIYLLPLFFSHFVSANAVTAALLSPPRFSHHRASHTTTPITTSPPLIRLVSTAAACHSVCKSHIKE